MKVLNLRNISGRNVSKTHRVKHGLTHTDTERNLVHLLINIVRQGIRSPNFSIDNKVQIITFNYDQILEHVLDKQFENTESDLGSWRQYIEILHVHGSLGELVEEIRKPSEVTVEWASGIHVVQQKSVPEVVRDHRKKAQKIIQNAEEIYACGFAFSGPNCRLLGIDQPQLSLSKRTISFCNFNGNVGLSKAVKKFENLAFRQPGGTNFGGSIMAPFGTVETNLEEDAGTNDKPLGVSDWFKIGHVGESPA